jgi:transketolase
MREALVKALSDLFEINESTYLITADTGFHVLDDFQRRFARRYLNAGIAEASMIGLAAGLAMQGKQVFVYGVVPFVTMRCLEQIRNDLCYPKLPVRVIGVGGGLTYGPAGMSHHSIEDIGLMRALPNMTVICPGDPVEVAEAIVASVPVEGPCYLRLGKTGERVVHTGGTAGLEVGKGIRLRNGDDLAVIGAGNMLPTADDVCNALAAKGLQPSLVSMHTVKPIDGKLIADLARQCRTLVTIEEHSIIGGLGSAVAEVISERALDARLHVFALPDAYCHRAGSQEYLRRSYNLSADQIVERILRVL